MNKQAIQSDIVVGDKHGVQGSKRNRRYRWHLNRWTVIASCVVVVIIVGTVLFVHFHHKATKPTTHPLPSYQDPKRLQKYYDQQIAAGKADPAAQAAPYFEKAQLYMNQNDYKTALPLLLKAVQLQPANRLFVETTGDVYAHLGNDAAAKASYEQDITLVQKTAGFSPADQATLIKYYQSKISTLKGS